MCVRCVKVLGEGESLSLSKFLTAVGFLYMEVSFSFAKVGIILQIFISAL